MIKPLFVFVGLVFCSLVSVFSLLFWSKWWKVLVTDESAGPVGHLHWGFWYLGSLDSVSPLIELLGLLFRVVWTELDLWHLLFQLVWSSGEEVLVDGSGKLWLVWSMPQWLKSAGVHGSTAATRPGIRWNAIILVNGSGGQNPGRDTVPLVGRSLTYSGFLSWACLANVFWWGPSHWVMNSLWHHVLGKGSPGLESREVWKWWFKP